MSFAQLLTDTQAIARKRGEIASLAHVAWIALGRSSWAADRRLKAASAEIEKRLLPQLKASDVRDGLPKTSYTPAAVESAFYNFRATHPDGRRRLVDAVLFWLLRGSFKEGTLNACRQILDEENVEAALSTPPDVADSFEVVDDDFVDRETAVPLVGRDNDLEDHLGFLAQAVRERQPYLLVGAPGVGKSLFLRHLLGRATKSWPASGDPALRTARFVFLSDADFLASATEVGNRLEALYAKLAAQPNLVPVFDGFQLFLNDTLAQGEIFVEYFGSSIRGSQRAHVLVAQTDPAGASPLLKGIQAWRLAGLDAATALPVVRARLLDAAGRSTTPMNIVPGADAFATEANQLALDRYPGAPLPHAAIRLVEATVHVALARAQSRDVDPVVTLLDLRDHVAKEQGLSIELIGKDPAEFYGSMAVQIKTGDVIGQDHAIDRICKVLLRSSRVARHRPRGRFLLVGPPGVGKTQLGKSLARQLGYGLDGFFNYNMGDFAGEGDRWRFIGAPAGYEGFSDVRTIFDEVRARPSCVILLDEIDRAHASIQDVLLAMLEGECKDARNERVYFSQAIFLMTTNQGQDAVTAAYSDGRNASMSRADIGARFNRILRDGGAAAAAADSDADEDALRAMIVKGTSSRAEAILSDRLQSELDELQAEVEENDDSAAEDLAARYLHLRRLREEMKLAIRRTVFDRAFLDRVDFIIPFFPLKEPDLVERILTLKLAEAGWSDCPSDIKARILGSALKETESGRALERLIEQALSDREQPTVGG